MEENNITQGFTSNVARRLADKKEEDVKQGKVHQPITENKQTLATQYQGLKVKRRFLSALESIYPFHSSDGEISSTHIEPSIFLLGRNCLRLRAMLDSSQKRIFSPFIRRVLLLFFRKDNFAPFRGCSQEEVGQG